MAERGSEGEREKGIGGRREVRGGEVFEALMPDNKMKLFWGGGEAWFIPTLWDASPQLCRRHPGQPGMRAGYQQSGTDHSLMSWSGTTNLYIMKYTVT